MITKGLGKLGECILSTTTLLLISLTDCLHASVCSVDLIRSLRQFSKFHYEVVGFGKLLYLILDRVGAAFEVFANLERGGGAFAGGTSDLHSSATADVASREDSRDNRF